MCCKDVTGELTELGFDIKDGRKGGHKIFTHEGLPDFISGSFDCGHGRNPEIKPAYIRNIIRTLETHSEDLVAYLKRVSGGDS